MAVGTTDQSESVYRSYIWWFLGRTRRKRFDSLVKDIHFQQNGCRASTAAGLAQSVKRLTAEREVTSLIPRAGPLVRVLK